MPRNKRFNPNSTPVPVAARVQAGPAGTQTTIDAIKIVQTAVKPWIDKLEAVLGYKVIAFYLEDQAVPAAMADEQVLHLFEHLRRIGKQQRLGLWINSRGGASEVPWRIVSLIREFADEFSVLIGYRAHSAATVVALGANEIVMTEMAELGPVDPSRNHPLLPKEEKDGKHVPIAISVQDLRHVLKFLERELGKDKLTPNAAATVYTALFEKVHPLAIGALEQSWTLSQQISEQVLGTHMAHDSEDEKAKIMAIVDRLSDYYKSHLYQISRKEAKAIGLKAREATAVEGHIMWMLYLAYQGIQIDGKVDLGGQQGICRRLGHIDSTVGDSLGLALYTQKQPPEAIGARWESQWLVEPVVPPGVP